MEVISDNPRCPQCGALRLTRIHGKLDALQLARIRLSVRHNVSEGHPVFKCLSCGHISDGRDKGTKRMEVHN